MSVNCQNTEDRYTADIFESVLTELSNKDTIETTTVGNSVLEDTEPQDITETIHICLNDETIGKSNCSLIAYGIHVNEDDDIEAYNPKSNPDKAVDIMFDYPENNIKIEVFLDTDSAEWDSWINGNIGKLSPEQMQDFFKSDFYSKLVDKLSNDWPTEDELFSKLLNGLKTKKYRIDGFVSPNQSEEDGQIDEGSFKFRKHNIKPGKAREKNAAGVQIRTNSGRLIVKYNDMNVQKSTYEAYYSWPGYKVETDPEKVFKWSRWNDWSKQKPFLRCRFAFNTGGTSPDIIGISITPFEEDDPNRGWISYNLSLEPSLQYNTPQETADILKLSIIRKFIRESLKRIEPLLSIPDEEIFERIGRPDKCTIDDIRKTKRVFKNTLKAVRNPRVNSFIYS